MKNAIINHIISSIINDFGFDYIPAMIILLYKSIIEKKLNI